MKRRRFLKIVVGLFSSTAAISFLYPLLKFLAPPSIVAETSKVILQKKDVPIGKSRDVLFNNVPSIVINRRDKGFIAFSKVCTHLGCLVVYDEGKKLMLCPCHAGTFDLEGNVISGPPPKPLVKLPLKVEGDNIIIG